ncbi:TPA: SPI-2 type III secretion system effector SifA [Salmonella enterica]|uniref:SifA n=1 Tax=Salmonella enterica TaxID=28901 RepID=Q8VTL2_SALER|nr:SifA [Salmonella enterica]EBH9039690.1 type III secretion system effector SifA [Salmonella enterica subsp. indica serovar 11:b:e,n,x]HBC0144365.1 SPI-2 type III secretion system effector SifA [Salmonella enterica subsp. indica serovar 11:b:e,n,x]HBC0166196.1 SPI-2 type III secretion system effector SifA [Salmonella enterica subsp. indica]HCL5298538.1 SPI-2 type III secretion system effector SifA [Salmonella enterica]
MPITIGNGYLKSEIFITPPGNTREAWWKVLWEKIKDFFFSTGKAKADSCLHEMLFADSPPSRERLTEIFFELKALACASHKDRFQVYNPRENDATIIFRIMDENEEVELLRITQSTDTFSYKIMGRSYFLIEDYPGILKSHPQMRLVINKRYSEVVDYPLPSTLCLKLAGAPMLSVPLDNIDGYLYSEWRKGNLDEWKAQEKATYLEAKIQSGIKKTIQTLRHANISESTQQSALLKTMTMCGLKPVETPPPHTHIPIEKMVEEVLLADKKFQACLVSDASVSQNMLADIIETIADKVFHALFRIDPQVIQKMAEEQLTTLHVRSDQQRGDGLCCFL